MTFNQLVTGVTLAAIVAFTPTAVLAQKKYDVGASDTEIKIGNIMPYSGPASAYGVVGKAEAAYFTMINDMGGINGRKITFVTYDDGYSPPKTVEQARKLVESDEALLVFSPLGTPTNSAIQKYLNSKRVPHLFASTGATKWNDPKNFPWTMGWQPSYQSEARIYARYIVKERPKARIGVLYQNDDLGKDYLKGLRDGLGANSSMIVAEESYETAEPTIDSHIVKLKASGADVFVSITTPKFAAQAIKKSAEIAWHPMHIVTQVAASVGGVIEPAGFEISQGLLSATYAKDVADPQWKDDPGMKKVSAFLDKYYPHADRSDNFIVVGYGLAQTMSEVLRRCGDELTRENVMKQAANLKKVEIDMLLPGITINTSANDFAPIDQFQMMRFKDKKWELFGEIVSGELSAQ